MPCEEEFPRGMLWRCDMKIVQRGDDVTRRGTILSTTMQARREISRSQIRISLNHKILAPPLAQRV